MLKTEDIEQINNFISENKDNFFMSIHGTMKEEVQEVSVNFYDTRISLIEPALGFAITKSELLRKGIFGGILMEFQHLNNLENSKI